MMANERSGGKTRRPELLMPAGSLEVLKTAVHYGADAVYLGGPAFGLRAKAHNFSLDEMAEGIDFAHAHGVRVHVTVNIVAHNRDLPGVREYLGALREIRPDALIISDPGIFALAGEIAPEIERHISTQTSCSNAASFNFWYGLGARRVVAARELSVAELAEIRRAISEDREIECFVHGAMCMAISGRCLISAYLTGRSANAGACTHPCRWEYALVEKTRPGEYFPVEEDGRGTYLFNSRDLCMIDHLDDLMDAGVNSFKVEGRMKTALYVATVARAYRHAIDDLCADRDQHQQNRAHYVEEVSKGTIRAYTTGFYYGNPGAEGQIYGSNTYLQNYIYLGIVRDPQPDGTIHLIQKNKFCTGDKIEILRPNGTDVRAEVLSIRGEDGILRDSAPHPGEKLTVQLSAPAGAQDVLRKKAPEAPDLPSAAE